MGRLDPRTAARVRELVGSIRTFDPDPQGPSVLAWATSELASVLGTEKANVFTLRQEHERIGLGRLYTVGLPPSARRLFGGWLSRQPAVGWSAYNPIRPEPRQRNRVLDLAAVERLTGVSRASAPIHEFLRVIGVGSHEQLRVLLCDGASLLAYVGFHQPDSFTKHQKATLAALVPALGRRLALERLVASGERKSAALDAALEAIGRPAFVVSSRGAIHEVNAAGRALLQRAGADVRRALVDASARRPSRYAFDVTPLRTRGQAPGYIAVLRDAPAHERSATCAAAAAARWGLTLRQREALAWILRGLSNATIAAELGVSERRIEQHVSAIFDRVGVESRAALVATVLQAVP